MKTNSVWCVVTMAAMIAAATPIHAARKNKAPVVAPPSSAKDTPPPGAAMSLSVP